MMLLVLLAAAAALALSTQRERTAKATAQLTASRRKSKADKRKTEGKPERDWRWTAHKILYGVNYDPQNPEPRQAVLAWFIAR